MKFIDHILSADYDDLLPYLPSMDKGRYLSKLRELTDIICESRKKENAIKALARELDCDEVTPESTFDEAHFDGNPRTEYGEVWIQSVARKYNLEANSESINMLRNAISIYVENEQTAINPKRNKRNYNRYIACEIGMNTEWYYHCDCLVFITTSSEYAFNEQDIQQIKRFIGTDYRNLIIHPRVDEDCGMGLELDIFICTRDYELLYETNPIRVNKILDELFDYEEPPFCLYRSDFDRAIDCYDLYRIAQLTSQCGVGGLVEQLKAHSQYCIIPTAQTAILCLEYKKECRETYHELMEVLDTLKELMPHTIFTWGARENHTLPENGYRITILTDIPDDHYQLHLMCSVEDV